MSFQGFGAFFGESRAARMIREHSRWLTRAVRGNRSYPRIPVRRVSDGGFARLMSTRQGRRYAEQWWAGTLEKID